MQASGRPRSASTRKGNGRVAWRRRAGPTSWSPSARWRTRSRRAPPPQARCSCFASGRIATSGLFPGCFVRARRGSVRPSTSRWPRSRGSSPNSSVWAASCSIALARLILCVGAIDCDPPRTENAVRGMAKQYRELPPLSHVTRAVGAAIEASLLSGDRECAWMSTWVAMTRPDSGPDSGQSPGPESDPGSSPESGPLPKAARPRAEIRKPPPPIRTPSTDTSWPGADCRSRSRRRPLLTFQQRESSSLSRRSTAWSRRSRVRNG